MGAERAPVTDGPHSSALMTHSAAGDASDWSVRWSKQGFGKRWALIGSCARPSIQTGLIVGNCKERLRITDLDCSERLLRGFCSVCDQVTFYT